MLISEETMRKRYEAAVGIMNDLALEAMFFVGDHMPGDQITGDFHYFVNNYVLNFRHCVLLFRDSEPVLLSGGWIQTQAAERNCWIKDCRQGASAEAIAEKIPQILTERGVTKGLIGTNFEFISLSVYNSLQTRLPNIQLIDVHPNILKLRTNLDEEEIRLIKRSAEICDGTYEYIRPFIKPGVTENKLRAELINYMISSGAEETFNLVSSGHFSLDAKNNTLFLPYVPNASFKTIAEGDTVMLEITPQYDGYWSQLVRYMTVSKPNRDLQRVHDLTLEILEAAAAKIRPGNRISDVVLAMHVKMEEITDEFRLGSNLGHTCALDLSEYLIKKDTDAILYPGMALIIHPSILTSEGNCESFWGETYMVTKNGYERLMKAKDSLYVL
jgi:Xaa-Pro aminopeptidase